MKNNKVMPHQVNFFVSTYLRVGFRSVVFCRGRKTGEPREKLLTEQDENQQKKTTGIEPGSQRWVLSPSTAHAQPVRPN